MTTRKNRMYDNLAKNKYYDVKVGFTFFQAFVFWFLGVMILNLIVAHLAGFPIDLIFFGGCLWFLHRKFTQLQKDADAVKKRVEEIRESEPEEDLTSQD